MNAALAWMPKPVQATVGLVLSVTVVIGGFLAVQGWVDSRAEAAVKPVRDDLTTHKDAERATLEKLDAKLDVMNVQLHSIATDVAVIKASSPAPAVKR